MLEFRLAFFAVAISIALCGVSNAAIVTINTTINIGSYNPGNSLFVPFTTPPVISTGDSVDLTVNFALGQGFRIQDNGNAEYFYGWMDGVTVGGNFTISNIQLDFLGFSGSPGTLSTLTLPSQSTGSGHLGPHFTNFLSAGQHIEFTSYRVRYDVTALQAGTDTYRSLWFISSGDNIAVSAVPEPSTLAMFGLGGLGLAFSALRRRFRKSA